MSRRSPCHSLILLGLVSLALTWAGDLFAKAEKPAPRPISDAERAAVGLLLAYADDGAAGWWPRLTADSPHREWGETQFRQEVELRVGPRSGSLFVLQTPGTRHDENVALARITFASGIEDLLEMRFRQEGGEPKLHRVRILADPRPASLAIDDVLASSPPALAPSAPTLSAAAASSAAASSVATISTPAATLLSLGLLAFLGLLVHVARHPSTRRLGTTLAPLCGLTFALALPLACGAPDTGAPESRGGAADAVLDDADGGELVSIAVLAPLREALFGGAELDLDQLKALLPDDAAGETRQSARAMMAQILFAGGRLAQAEKVLQNFDTPASRPLVALLRARLALQQSRDGEVVDLYDTALRRAPDVDLLRLEAGYAAAIMAWDQDARIAFEFALEAGSRMAETWYAGSQLAALDGSLEKAEERFETAFRLEPLTRESLFDDPLLSTVGTRPRIFSQLHFDRPEEPEIRPEMEARRPLELPAGAAAFTVGERLDIELGGSTFRLLGAGDLIPAGTPVRSAAEVERQEREATLARLDEIKEDLLRPGGLAHPAVQRQAKLAALTLAKQRRWQDVLHLTDLAQGPTLPADLAKLRGQALLETGFESAAKELLIELARSDRVNRRKDPGTYYQLAEMFVRTGEYDLALRLIQKANGMSPQKVSPQRIRQIEMDRELDKAFSTFESEHFVLRYPRATGSEYPQNLSHVLEAERTRLRRWIPVDEKAGKIEIHLFELEKFMQAYSGGVSVLGIYDGKVRVPFADLKSFHPLLVNIVSHEIAHAMVDQVTGGRTPKWFNEGLASHIEMQQNALNPIPDMHDAGRYLSFAIMEPVLAGFSEPQLVELAYIHSTWALHFIESRWGIGAIHRLLRAFGDGLGTEAALRRVLKKDIEDFDRAFKAWAIDEAPEIWPTELVRYDGQFDAYIKRDTAPSPKKLASAGRYALPPSKTDRGLKEKKPARAGVDSRREEAARQAAEKAAAETAAAFRTWHAKYATATRPVKLALGQTLAILNGKKKGDLAASCQKLGSALEPLHGKTPALRAPSAAVSKALTSAYLEFDHAARTCRRGDRDRMRHHLDAATAALGRAYQGLKAYGLKP